MQSPLQDKLTKIPMNPGVYLYKDSVNQIIYVGKAARLRSRVRQYFQKSRISDAKTDALVAEIADLDWIALDSEADALFLEAELIRRYRPKFNILMRDDKSQLFVRIDSRSDYPTVTTLRRPLDDGAEYFGPYINGYALKKALRYLRKAFPYATSRPNSASRTSLYYQLGLDPGLEKGKTNLSEYRTNLRKLKAYLKGQKKTLFRSIEKEMKLAAETQNFEKAAIYRNQLKHLYQLNNQVLFGDKESIDLTVDEALSNIASLIGLVSPPKRIEAYDVSHIQGADRSASMVVFKNGVPDKTSYRKFKLKPNQNDDFAGLAEALIRRFRPENVKKWPLPDLVIIDGGKGQLKTSILAINQMGYKDLPLAGLAKKMETIILDKQDISRRISDKKLKQTVDNLSGRLAEKGNFYEIILPQQSPALKLLQRLRDESHRFAVSYHSSLARSRQTTSWLEEIPGIGPSTRKKLIRKFGSARAVQAAEPSQLSETVGPQKASIISSYLRAGKLVQ